MKEPDRALKHVRDLLHRRDVPELPGDLADNSLLAGIHAEIAEIREVMRSFARWDLDTEIVSSGILPGCLKSLRSSLRHLIRRIQMIGRGDFSPQKYPMGELSGAVNSMVRQIDSTLRELREKEEKLNLMTANLRSEVAQRNSAVEALRESESRFRYLADHDPLTGTLNRRSFMERAAFELQAAVTQNSNCCLAMMDIDHFKRFNDRYGHVAGDEALRHTVRTVSGGLRRMDFMGRYGGEEFVVFFHGADLAAGRAACERLRARLASAPLMLDAEKVFITASFGVAAAGLHEFPVPAESVSGDADRTDISRWFVDRADRALYQAKGSGRNRVVSFGENPAPSPGQEEPGPNPEPGEGSPS